MTMTKQMISVFEAEEIIQKSCGQFSTIRSPTADACGAVLRENIYADRDHPNFQKVFMDGIAISLAAWQKGVRSYTIEGIQAAGQKENKLQNPHGCWQVMTGAVLPRGTDCVIPIEQVKMDDNEANVNKDFQPLSMQYVLKKAADFTKGTLLVKKGDVLLAQQIAMLVSVGKAKVKISARPSIAIISTGNEIVGINARIKPYQIRPSNAYGLQAALSHHGFSQNRMFHLPDDKKILLTKLDQILQKFDILIVSGGVSMGKYDFIPAVMKELKIKILFHTVRQKPGKPFAFGITKRGKMVFALPGNPASTHVCFYRYVLPQLKRSMGAAHIEKEFYALSTGVTIKNSLSNFLPVRIKSEKGARLANPVTHSGSGDLLALAHSDGFVELAAGQNFFDAKTVVPFYRWGWF